MALAPTTPNLDGPIHPLAAEATKKEAIAKKFRIPV
jgi:hypothetical protein